MRLENRVIIVTGASSGIGRETALLLGMEKARLVLGARRIGRLQELAARIESAGGEAVAVETDVSDQAQVERLVQAAVDRFERVDALVNNAGVGLYASVEKTTVEQMERIWRTNFLGTFYGIRAVLPVMRKQGSGQIVTVSSVVGRRATPYNGAYCSTKFAQVGLMETLRNELRGSGIRTTVVYPSSTESEFLEALENPENLELKRYGPVQTSAQVAERIVGALRHPRPEVMTNKLGRVLVIANAVSPRMVDWLVSRTIKRKIRPDL